MTSLALTEKQVLRIELDRLTHQANDFFSGVTDVIGQDGTTEPTRTKRSGCMALSHLILKAAIYEMPRSKPVRDERLNEEALQMVSTLTAELLKHDSGEVNVVAKVVSYMKPYKYLEEVRIWEFLEVLEACGLSEQKALDHFSSVIFWAKEQVKETVVRLVDRKYAGTAPPSQSDLDFSKPATRFQQPDTSETPRKKRTASRRKANIPV